MSCLRGPTAGRLSLHSSLAMKAIVLLSPPFPRSACRKQVWPCHSNVTSAHSVSSGLHKNINPLSKAWMRMLQQPSIPVEMDNLHVQNVLFLS